MKSLLVFGLIYMLLLPLLAIGCDKSTADTTTPNVPAINGGEEAKIIDITLDEFSADKNMVKNIELLKPGSLIVRLGSNESTGFTWGDAKINDTNVIIQASKDFVGPQDTGIVGAAGTDVWVFDSVETGTATISFSYSRPWEGGEKDEFTLTINVTVK